MADHPDINDTISELLAKIAENTALMAANP